RNVAQGLVALVAFVPDMAQDDVAKADRKAIGPADGLDAVIDALVNDAFEADARIIPKESQLRVGGISDAGKKAHPPRRLAAIGECCLKVRAIAYFEPLIGVDIEDPVPGGLLEREIARGREVVAPGKGMERDWKSACFANG